MCRGTRRGTSFIDIINKIYYHNEKGGPMDKVLQQILKICEERYLGPNKMDRKHVILHNNESLQQIKDIIEKELTLKV